MVRCASFRVPHMIEIERPRKVLPTPAEALIRSYSHRSEPVHIHSTGHGKWPARLAFAAALTFTLASGGTNLVYGWNKGTDLPGSLVWAAVSVGASIVFALSWPGVMASIDRRQWSRALMVFVALLLTGTYSVAAALGSAMGGRTNAAIEESDITGKRARAQAAYDSAKDELSKLPHARLVDEITALVARAAMNPRAVAGCTAINGSTQMSCPKLEGELARARQRQKLQIAMDKASGELAKVGAPKVANTDAVALARYATDLGWKVDADYLNKLLALLAVLVVECGGGLALAVGMSLSEKDVTAQSVRMGATHSRGSQPAQPPTIPDQKSNARPVHSPAQSSRDRLLAMVRDANGVLRTGHRGLGEALGVSATRAGQLMRDLATDGAIRVRASKTGSVITLAPRLVTNP